MGSQRGVAADAYAPVSGQDPSPTHTRRPAPRAGPGSSTGSPPPSLALPVSASVSAAGGFVNEVTFGFFDGAAETPEFAAPSLRPTASPGHVTAHGAASARANVLQHLAGGSGIAGPASRWTIFITIALLLMLGIIPSTIIFLVDVSVHNMFAAREAIAVNIAGTFPGFMAYLTSGVALCLASTFACHVCSVDAEGSGIPQMKAIMSGFYDKLKPALSLWALLAKAVGLVCAIGGGLPVGWEGPNVHISCIIAHHLARLPFFSSLRRDRALRMQIMACACAVGLASSFGTPIGGVLYALETTSSFYLVPTFWKSVVSTLAGALVYDLLYKTPLVEAFESTSFEAGDYTRGQLVNFAVMGVLFGVLGAFFVRCVHSVYLLRKKRLAGINRYILLGVVGAVAATVQYPLRLFRLDPRLAINEFFSATNLETLSSLDVALLLLIKFPLIVVSIGLPIPAGVFIPSFLLGSGLGRLYGEALRLVFGDSIVPGGYAVVGAAAFTAGVTRALSCAVVIFEVTGQLKHMEPTLVAVALSVVVANTINRSLYDTLIIMKELPYMPHMRRDRSPAQVAAEVMHTDVVALYSHTTLGAVRAALDACPRFDSFPVVNDSMLLLGSVRRRSLVAMLNAGGRDDIDADGVVDPYGNNSVIASMTGSPAKVARRRKRVRPRGRAGDEVSGDEEQGRRLLAASSPNGPSGDRETLVLDSAELQENGALLGGEDGAAAFAGQAPADGDLSAAVNEAEFADSGGGGEGTGQNGNLNGGHRATYAVVNGYSLGPSAHVDDASRVLDDDYGADKPAVLVPDLSPLVVTDNTSLSQLHFMFVMLMPTHAYVLSDGRLQGVVKRSDLVVTGAILASNVPPPR
jgi:H+/Cl- antiporter ClcA